VSTEGKVATAEETTIVIVFGTATKVWQICSANDARVGHSGRFEFAESHFDRCWTNRPGLEVRLVGLVFVTSTIQRDNPARSGGRRNYLIPVDETG